MRLITVFYCFYEGIVWAAYLAYLVQDGKTGEEPCAVPLSADMALYSTLQTKPISIFWLGTIRTISDSSGDNLTIFSASLKTSDADRGIALQI